jgi:ribonuclease BN (tRNA processing enzyme)
LSEPDSLTVTVLGCDGSFPGPGGATSGYLLTCGVTRVWLDAGSGTMAQLQLHIPLEAVDAVVLSHQHPDHWADLDHFAVACRWVLGLSGLPVYAPAGLRDLTRAASAQQVFDWRDIGDGGEATVGTMRFSFFRTDHPVETLACRVEGGGRCLGYSADSGSAWGLESLGAGLHLALCEATFLSDKEDTVQHLSARQAGRTARAAGVERLVITHLEPGTDRQAAAAEATASFGRPVTVAAQGDRFVA